MSSRTPNTRNKELGSAAYYQLRGFTEGYCQASGSSEAFDRRGVIDEHMFRLIPLFLYYKGCLENEHF